jgi:8-oxo-dGTP diphosphatase
MSGAITRLAISRIPRTLISTIIATILAPPPGTRNATYLSRYSGIFVPVPRPFLVVAGVIERDGLVLVCQRQAGDTHPFKWEFPGGKVETGETPRQALQRELTEELGITAEIGDEIARYEYRYARRPPILLIFYRVTEFTGDPKPLAFEEIRWEPYSRLPAYDFLDGDREFIRRLARQH